MFIVNPFFNFNILNALLVVFYTRSMYSLLFMLHSQITHLHSNCMINDNDWYKHQVITAYNYGVNKPIYYILSGGLNYQIEHHLFPGVNQIHHNNLNHIIKKICNKYNVEYKYFNNYYDAIKSYYKYLIKISKK